MNLKAIFINGKNLLSRQQNSILSAAFVLAAAFGLSALLGILRDRFLYARFYACCADQLDAYNAAFRLPDLVFQLLVIGALSSAFIPIFSEKLLESEEKAFQIARATGTFLFCLFLPLAGAIFFFARPLSSLITASFTSEQVSLMANLTRIMIFAQFFFLLSNLTTGILQAKKRFFLPALSPITYNLGIIFGIQALSPLLGIYGPAAGVLLGSLLHFLIQLPLALHLGFSLKPDFSFHLPEIKRIFTLMIPRSLALGLGQIESTIVLFLATTFPPGSLSLLYLAEHLTNLSSRLFGATIGQAALPSLSSLIAAKRHARFSQVLVDSLLESLYLAILAAVILLVLRIPIVRLAFGARQFPWKATLQTGRVLAFFSPAVIAQAGSQILTRGFYSLQDTRRPLIVSFFSLIIVVCTSVIGIFFFRRGILALVVAVSLAATIRFLALLLIISRRIEGFPWPRLWSFAQKIFLVVVASASVFWLSMRFLDHYLLDTSRVSGLLLLTLLSLLSGGSVYLFCSLRLGLKESKVFLNLVKKVFNLHQIMVISRSQMEKPQELLETRA